MHLVTSQLDCTVAATWTVKCYLFFSLVIVTEKYQQRREFSSPPDSIWHQYYSAPWECFQQQMIHKVSQSRHLKVSALLFLLRLLSCNQLHSLIAWNLQKDGFQNDTSIIFKGSHTNPQLTAQVTQVHAVMAEVIGSFLPSLGLEVWAWVGLTFGWKWAFVLWRSL